MNYLSFKLLSNKILIQYTEFLFNVIEENLNNICINNFSSDYQIVIDMNLLQETIANIKEWKKTSNPTLKILISRIICFCPYKYRKFKFIE